MNTTMDYMPIIRGLKQELLRDYDSQIAPVNHAGLFFSSSFLFLPGPTSGDAGDFTENFSMMITYAKLTDVVSSGWIIAVEIDFSTNKAWNSPSSLACYWYHSNFLLLFKMFCRCGPIQGSHGTLPATATFLTCTSPYGSYGFRTSIPASR